MQSIKLCKALLERAMRYGATQAMCALEETKQTSLTVRDSQIDDFAESVSNWNIALRAWVGKQVSSVSGNNASSAALDALAQHACEMAKANTEDPHILLAESNVWPHDLESLLLKLQLSDEISPPTVEELTEWAHEMEEAALSVDRVSRTEGAQVGMERSRIALMTTNGFEGAYEDSAYSAGIGVIAGEGDALESDYDEHTVRFRSDIRPMEEIGKKAAERACARLGSELIETGKIPVVFDRRISGSLLDSFFQAIGGENVHTGSTFLKGKMLEQIFSPTVTVVDDPHISRGLGTRPFDADGVATKPLMFVENGRLKSWAMSLRSASKLGLKTTGHASGFSNLFMQRGIVSREELLSDIERGLLVTQLMGEGADIATGAYSRGAAGFLIEKGKLVHPVNGVNIAGNLSDMFMCLTLADDLVMEEHINAPTVRIDGMTVAGK